MESGQSVHGLGAELVAEFGCQGSAAVVDAAERIVFVVSHDLAVGIEIFGDVAVAVVERVEALGGGAADPVLGEKSADAASSLLGARDVESPAPGSGEFPDKILVAPLEDSIYD